MKAIVPLLTATLFVVCSAFPAYEKITKGQRSGEMLTKGQGSDEMLTKGRESDKMPTKGQESDEMLTKGRESDEMLTKGRESNNFCATLAYPQRNPTAYVHLCHTPGEGTTRTPSRICVYVTVYLILLAGLVAIFSFLESDLHAVLY